MGVDGCGWAWMVTQVDGLLGELGSNVSRLAVSNDIKL